jgi:hypothetical protein
VKSPSRLLRQIDEWEMDDGGAVFIDHTEDVLFTYETYWRGLVSGRSYCAVHEASMPGPDFIRAAEQREMLALEDPTIGGMQ